MTAPARLTLPLLAAVFLAPAPAPARTARFLRPTRHERLAAGQIVEVEWPSGCIPERADEMELVLSLDGGRSFPVRVTGEILTDDTHVAWRVPSLRTSSARLALRVGDGEEGSETILVVSDAFEIRPDPSLSGEPLLRVRGEWRTREAVTLPESPLPAPRGLSREADLRAAERSESGESAPRSGTPQAPNATSVRPARDREGRSDLRRIVSSSPRLAPAPLRL